MYIGDYYFEIPDKIPQLNVTSIYYLLFIFVCFILSRSFNSKLRPFILFIANAFFIYTFGIYNLIAILLLAFYCYLIAFYLQKRKTKSSLIISIVPYILLLLFFKYKGLFNFHDSLLMPLGLSFYSFKIVSYLVDIYKGTCENEKNILYLFDYILFFPCVTAGPINRAKPFLDELKNPTPFEYKDSKNGGIQVLLGIFEKIVFCDYITYICNLILNNQELNGLNTILGIFLYSFVIYLDFDAYSNIAIGTASLLGFKFDKNFNSPYISRNLKEFWNSWHISLSSFLKDYIYIPFGGSKKGKYRKYLNILIVFLVSGIWHGSTINFIIWGLLNGLIRIVEELIPIKNNNFFLNLIRMAKNFIIVTFLWLIFRYQNIQDVINILKAAFEYSPLNYKAIGISFNEAIWLIIVLAIVIILDILRKHFDMINVLSKQFILFRWIFYITLIIIFLIFGVYGTAFNMNDFIYQWF